MLDLRIGLLLGFRQIQRANPWTTILIIIVILFTFLNLVVVGGILVGIVEGVQNSVRDEALGDIIMKPLETEGRVLETERILKELETYTEVEAYSAHYEGMVTIEANYNERRDLSTKRDIIAVNLTGVDIKNEAKALNLSSLVGEGEYFKENEQGYILLGKYFVDRYAAEYGDVFDSLDNIYPGATVRLTVGSKTEEFIVKGILNSKIDLVSTSVYIPEKEFRRLFDRADHNAETISVRLKAGVDEFSVTQKFNQSDFSKLAKIQSFTESTPKFITDITDTFNLLGLLIGAIGVFVASITIFIVVFINALSRRRQIGILKAVGITRKAIEFAYITQAAFYAVVGSTIGMLVTFFILVPYFVQNPIDFPFSDGALSVTLLGALGRCAILFSITIIAGFFPAWMIVRQNTLNSILGRK